MIPPFNRVSSKLLYPCIIFGLGLAPTSATPINQERHSDFSDDLIASSEFDARMTPCGINPQPEWALDKVGPPPMGDGQFVYPDTTVPVRLYLIDSSVANPNNWMGANPKLTLERTELVRGVNDPQTFSTDHATKMLSLIGGLETGISAGTPISVVNYDIYPTAESTTVALLSTAILRAVSDAATTTTPMRSAICIATSSSLPASFANYSALKVSIDRAVNAGIPVIVSAGNLGSEADIFIPAAYGSLNGVICVGASDTSDVIIPMSNSGTPVDLLAPGAAVFVRTDSASVPFGFMTGTSPAAALVTGAVLTELSINGSLTPAQVEASIKNSARLPLSGLTPRILATTVAAAATIATPDGPIITAANPVALSCDPSFFSSGTESPVMDVNSNGVADVIDGFYGSSQVGFVSPKITRTADAKTKFTFPVARELVMGSAPFTLANGCQWRLRSSVNTLQWETPVGSLEKSTDSMGTVWLTATFPWELPNCYVRLEIFDPSSL